MDGYSAPELSELLAPAEFDEAVRLAESLAPAQDIGEDPLLIDLMEMLTGESALDLAAIRSDLSNYDAARSAANFSTRPMDRRCPRRLVEWSSQRVGELTGNNHTIF